MLGIDHAYMTAMSLRVVGAHALLSDIQVACGSTYRRLEGNISHDFCCWLKTERI